MALETERGYTTTLPPGAFDLRRQLTFGDHGFVLTPIAGCVLVACGWWRWCRVSGLSST